MLTFPEERRAASHPYVAQFKRWWHEHLLQLCRLMLTFHEPETLLSWQIDSSWWYFAIANASEESRTRLVDIQTDPRICPYRIQLLWGSRWRSAKMFAGIEKITLEHSGVGQNFITSYLMVVERLGFACLYGGSATGYLRGERSRIFEDPSSHEKISALGLDEILWRRATDRNSDVLFIHEVMAQENTTHFYIAMYRYPMVADLGLHGKIRTLSLLSENYSVILTGSLYYESVPNEDIAAMKRFVRLVRFL